MQTIPIFFASDNNYASYMCIAMLSIAKNTSSFIEFYILDGGIDKWNKAKIKSIKKDYPNIKIEFIDMSNFSYDNFPKLHHYTLNTYSRYYIPQVKPNLDKVLYLDCDIIVDCDIAELYNQDLEDYALGAILEDYCVSNYTYLKSICPDYQGGSDYFNAGILLLSLNKFREQNLSDILINMTFALGDKLSTADQDVFNYIFAKNFKILAYKYNYVPESKEALLALGKTSVEEAINKPYIYHYCAEKPWGNKKMRNADKFWEIAEISPFFDELTKCHSLIWKQLNPVQNELTFRINRRHRAKKIHLLFGSIALFSILTLLIFVTFIL